MTQYHIPHFFSKIIGQPPFFPWRMSFHPHPWKLQNSIINISTIHLVTSHQSGYDDQTLFFKKYCLPLYSYCTTSAWREIRTFNSFNVEGSTYILSEIHVRSSNIGNSMIQLSIQSSVKKTEFLEKKMKFLNRKFEFVKKFSNKNFFFKKFRFFNRRLDGQLRVD